MRDLVDSDSRWSFQTFLSEDITDAASAIRRLMSGLQYPSDDRTLPRYVKLSTHSTWWASTDTSESGWPVPRFWSFVFGQEICIPKTEAAFWKDDRLSTADWDDVANKMVSSAYTRSVKDDKWLVGYYVFNGSYSTKIVYGMSCL